MLHLRRLSEVDESAEVLCGYEAITAYQCVASRSSEAKTLHSCTEYLLSQETDDPRVACKILIRCRRRTSHKREIWSPRALLQDRPLPQAPTKELFVDDRHRRAALKQRSCP
jgi:hypothetical protein